VLTAAIAATFDIERRSAHARAWSSRLPIADLKSFWGALGCACWAV
jgi:hypothetical protein